MFRIVTNSTVCKTRWYLTRQAGRDYSLTTNQSLALTYIEQKNVIAAQSITSKIIEEDRIEGYDPPFIEHDCLTMDGLIWKRTKHIVDYEFKQSVESLVHL